MPELADACETFALPLTKEQSDIVFPLKVTRTRSGDDVRTRQFEKRMQCISTIERAFRLAKCSVTVDEVRVALNREGYLNVDAHLAGPKIRSDLKRLLRK